MCAQQAPRFCDEFDGRVTLDEIRAELAEHAHAECPVCSGTGVLSRREDVWPELNLANANAFAIMRMVGVAPDYCGTLAHEALTSVVRGALRALNSEVTRAPHLLESVVEPAQASHSAVVNDGGQARIVQVGGRCEARWGGRDDDYLVDRARRLLDLLRFAQEQGEGITWG